ncbi:hypothetical protein N431DRAFT_470463 [Stipitochalara longipes BDJ]|nr:hypothetical protein N431DRAFT_470463 [Stipitochalara longipes BDJ]
MPSQKHSSGVSEPESSYSKATMPSNTSLEPKNFEKWVHTPTNLTLAWLLISIPLVIWDIGFVLLRPLSMTGGSLHWPLWLPYELYMQADYMYSWQAIEEKNGFTAAQGAMNVIETSLYIYYLYLVYSQGLRLKATRGGTKRGLLAHTHVAGQSGALAVVIGFATAVMTFSKTLLYGLNEVFSGWKNVGHNEWINLIFLWIIPNGAWLVSSAFMIIEFGHEILQRLSLAAGAPVSESYRR